MPYGALVRNILVKGSFKYLNDKFPNLFILTSTSIIPTVLYSWRLRPFGQVSISDNKQITYSFSFLPLVQENNFAEEQVKKAEKTQANTEIAAVLKDDSEVDTQNVASASRHLLVVRQWLIFCF